MRLQVSKGLHRILGDFMAIAVVGAVVGALAAGPAMAQSYGNDHGRSNEHGKPGYGTSHQQAQVRDRSRSREAQRSRERRVVHPRFSTHQRDFVHNYYRHEMQRGRCPPGLARKGSSCYPPGHAKRWRIGHRLPRDVIFYNLPHRIAADLGPPPRGYRYVRVSNDILLIAIGTGLVVDALQDLGHR